MSGLNKRISRLEHGTGEDGLLQIIAIDDCIGDADVVPWPDDVEGVRFADGTERYRREGEGGEAFRHRLSVEHGVRGPAGALPYAVVELISGVPA